MDILMDFLIGNGFMISYFVFLPEFLQPDDQFEQWLNNDGFDKNLEKDPRKKIFFKELNKLKAQMRRDLREVGDLFDEYGNKLNPAQIYLLIDSHKLRISKVRLMIEGTVYITYNTHKPTGVRYVVGRANWIDNDGKKIKKFSINLGPEQKVLVKGQIPPRVMEQLETDMLNEMWAMYTSEYPN